MVRYGYRVPSLWKLTCSPEASLLSERESLMVTLARTLVNRIRP
jgi:hypothetical protein